MLQTARNIWASFKERHIGFNIFNFTDMYIVGLSLLGSILVYPAGGMTYIDALFLSVSASTQCGLNVMNLSDMNTYQQVVFYFLFTLGTPVVTHTSVVFVRLHWFEKRFKSIVIATREKRRSQSRFRTAVDAESFPAPDEKQNDTGLSQAKLMSVDLSLQHSPTIKCHISNDRGPHQISLTRQPNKPKRRVSFQLSRQELQQESIDPHGSDEIMSTPLPEYKTQSTSSQGKNQDPASYLSWTPSIGRNSSFRGLTAEQRKELGGIEYRSLKTLSLVLIAYFWLFNLVSICVLIPWIILSKTWGPTVDEAGQSRVWWAIFTTGSLFTDCGYTLTPDSMISFQTAAVPLIIGAILIIAGQTGFPFMLRLFIWTIKKSVPENSAVGEEIRFLLDHPRRCFTLLFPGTATWWLVWFSAILNAIGVVFFIIMNLHNPTVTSINPAGFRILDGLFQAISTRTAGFSVINLANVHPALQVYYLIMMFIAVYPVAISVRGTNVYEEQSLGIWGSTEEEGGQSEKKPSYVTTHIQRQLSFDLWYVFLALFGVVWVEGIRIQDQSFSIFACLFEVVSAYGTVGVSLGFAAIDSSLSTKFSVVGKLVIIATMIRGRHRALPYRLDRAIMLPGARETVVGIKDGETDA